MPKVKIWPEGLEIEIDTDTNLLQALRDQNLYVRSSCGGTGSCSDCVIKIKGGEDELTPPPFNEIQLLGNVFHITKERLACQTKICGEGVEIDISNHDLKSDEERRSAKSQKKAKTRVVKKQNVEEQTQMRREKLPEPKKKTFEAGGRRPRLFRTDNLEEKAKAEEERAREHQARRQSVGQKHPRSIKTNKSNSDKKD